MVGVDDEQFKVMIGKVMDPSEVKGVWQRLGKIPILPPAPPPPEPKAKGKGKGKGKKK